MDRKLLIFFTIVLSITSVMEFLFLSAQASPQEGKWISESTTTATVNPTPTKTPTPPPPVFSATMHVIPTDTILLIGESIDVEVSIEVSNGCQYPIYELTLTQDGEDAPIFEYLTPITDTVGPGVGNPFTYSLKAEKAGTIRFQGLAYGEEHCGGSWRWRYVGGVSEQVTVIGIEGMMYLPIIGKNSEKNDRKLTPHPP